MVIIKTMSGSMKKLEKDELVVGRDQLVTEDYEEEISSYGEEKIIVKRTTERVVKSFLIRSF